MGFSFHVSDMRVDLVGLPAEAERGMRAVWQHALPVVPEAYSVRFEVEAEDGAFSVRTDGELRAAEVERADVLATVEAVLYHDLEIWNTPRRALLHAAAVHRRGITFVLSGASGSGKSSLAYALLERGGLYLTDELTLLEGGRVWGIPRAPQLDPVPVGTHLPSGFPPADLTSYVFRSVDGMRALPILPLTRAAIARAPYPADTVQLVFPRRDARTAMGRLAATEALRRLHAEVRGPAAHDLGPLLTRPPLALAWRTPAEGAEALLGGLPDPLPER